MHVFATDENTLECCALRLRTPVRSNHTKVSSALSVVRGVPKELMLMVEDTPCVTSKKLTATDRHTVFDKHTSFMS